MSPAHFQRKPITIQMDLRRLTAWHLWAAGSFNQRPDARLVHDDIFTVMAEASEPICMGTLYVEYSECLPHCSHDRDFLDACRPWQSCSGLNP